MEALVFDIETVPDLALIRQLYDWQELTDEEISAAINAKWLAEKGTTFLPLHLHQIVAISLVMRRDDYVKVWTLGSLESDEAEVVQRFYAGIDRYRPTLVSWNGTGFDLPVLHYRALKHKVEASQYWDMGEGQHDFRYNNYVNRYHQRHTDVMDVLALYQARASVKLDQMAVMLGYPGKMGMAGDRVAAEYAKGNIKMIRDYCETDVLNTYLVYLRFQMMRGVLTSAQLNQEEQLVQQMLMEEGQQSGKEHLDAFLKSWQDSR